ncbi:MAG: carboxypeptidase regulatory-like domain-containing protein [Pyrinomonadaceae bacterium]
MAIVLCLNNMLMAQDATGDIIGTVKDSNGAAVAGATVSISDVTKKIVVRTVTTNGDGEFNVTSLLSSVYNVTVEAGNFKKGVQTNVKVDVGQRRTVDVVLQAGPIDETVTVEADPVAVDLNSAASGTVINGDQVRELSINNRNFMQLVTLAPGVTNDLEDLVFTGTNNPETQVVNRSLISVNGGRPTSNTFTVDGADVTDRGSNLTIQSYPSVESIGEFRVLKQYSAESGQSAGGQVNVVTKGGGTKYHGSAFEFIRNEGFNANNVATNSNPNPPFGRDENGKAKRRPFRYNNYGLTFSGPIYFLKFGEKSPDEPYFGKYSKTFFFFSEEQRRDTRYPLLQGTVPTDAMENGVFPIDICLRGTVVGAVRTCLDTLPAGTNIATRATLSPLSQAYLNQIWKKVPGPTNLDTLRLDYPTLNIAKFRQEIIKVDHQFSSRASAYYRYGRDKIPTIDADGSIGTRSGLPFVNTMESDSPGRTHTAAMTYAFSPKVLFDARFTHGGGSIFTTTTGLIAKNVSTIPAQLPYLSARDVVPQLSVLGFSSLTGFSNYNNYSWKQSWASNLTWLSGNHQVKFGGQYSRYKKVENAIAGANQGAYSAFNNTPNPLPAGQTTSTVLAAGVATSNLNSLYQNWANFLMGNNISFTQSKFDLTADLRQRNIEAFAQDDWKIRRNLSINLGVRYSYFGAPWDANGHLTNFDPTLFSQAAAPRVTGAGNRVAEAGKNYCNGMIINAQNFQTGPAIYNCNPTVSPYGKYIYNAPKLNFAPRIGLAWDPFGKGTTAVRMGYGVYYDQVSGNQALLIVGLNPPYQETCTVAVTNIDQPIPGNNCTAVVFSSAAASIRGIQTEWNTPYVQQWSFDVQHQLAKKSIVTVGYYGSKGIHLNGHTEYNNLRPGVAVNTQCASGAATLQDVPAPTTVPCQTAGTAFTATPTILDQVRPYRGFRSISVLESRYTSDYHSLQISGQQRFSGASQLNLAYTWSKSFNDNPTSYINAAPQDNYNVGAERGLSPLDRRHVFTINGIYELPFFKEQSGFAGKVLGGWQLSGIVSYQTGSPYTITSASYDPGGIGFIPSIVAGGRPNLLCDPNDGAPHTIAQWFNTACFAPQTATGISNIAGTAGRGIIEGPPTKKVDMTLSKNFKFSENVKLQLRAEAFNVLNLVNYRLAGTPNLSRTSTTFGQITSFRDPRIMQFAAKINF